jgi:nicotinamide-nucleotide amidase
MIAEIISVGTELLLGDTIDTDAAYLARALTPIGIRLYRRVTVGDNIERLREAIQTAVSRADVVITIGGLGPTEDDLTKETVADTLRIDLIEDPNHAQWLISHAKLRNWGPLPSTYTKQATIPVRGRGIPNPNGTALGAIFETDTHISICLPGPPNEFTPMVDDHVLPYLAAKLTGTPSVIRSRTLRITGVPESIVEETVRDLITGTNPTVAPYAKLGEVHLRVTASAPTDVEAYTAIQPIVDEIKARLGVNVYGYDGETLESTVVGLLREQGKSIAAAESCTGGLIAKRITDVPNASHIFGLGIVAYANEAKVAQLGVPADLIARHGAVSPEVAVAMAQGIRRVAGADIGVSSTGVAGPGGGTVEKPVGTVDIGIVWGEQIYTERRHYLGSRADIAHRASQAALDLVRRLLIEGNLSKPVANLQKPG